MAASAEQLTVLGFDENYFRAQWKNLFVVIYRGVVTQEAAEAVSEGLDALRKRLNNRIGICAIVETSTPIPGPDVRRYTKEMFDRLGKDVAFYVAVPEGKSIWATTARTMLTALQLVTPSVYQQRIFADPAEGVPWIAEQMSQVLGSVVTAAEVSAVLNEARSRFPRTQAPAKEKAAGGLFSFLRKS
jgi:hypothetical protein